MPIAAGKLRHKVVVETSTSSREATYGDVQHTWSALDAPNGEVWANVKPLSGNERWIANAVTPEVTHRITMRYNPRVAPKDRIKYGTRTFGILSVLNIDERNEMIELMAVEQL